MQVMDKGKEKVQKICDALKKETLDPARKEAEEIVAKAEGEAEAIIAKAKAEAKKIVEKGKKKVEEERGVFLSSLHLSAKQVIAALREEIEEKLFTVDKALAGSLSDGEVVASFVTAMVKAVEKEGLHGDLLAEVGKSVDRGAVAGALAKEVMDRLKKEPVSVADMAGGARVKVEKERMVLDMSDETLAELLATYARADFRKFIFGEV